MKQNEISDMECSAAASMPVGFSETLTEWADECCKILRTIQAESSAKKTDKESTLKSRLKNIRVMSEQLAMRGEKVLLEKQRERSSK